MVLLGAGGDEGDKPDQAHVAQPESHHLPTRDLENQVADLVKEVADLRETPEIQGEQMKDLLSQKGYPA